MNDNDEWPHPDQVRQWWKEALEAECRLVAALLGLCLLALLWLWGRG